MDEAQLAGEIRKMLAEIAEEEEEKITGDAKFIDDLGMDSMLALELLAGLEKKYKIQIPEDKLPQLECLNKVVAVVKELLPK
ncbi:acyl carrier protein [Candidatus Margulisiibacteriota bacterium]